MPREETNTNNSADLKLVFLTVSKAPSMLHCDGQVTLIEAGTDVFG